MPPREIKKEVNGINCKEVWKLVDHNGKQVMEYQEVVCFRGKRYEITGGRPPHKIGSTGKVTVKPKETSFSSEFYPTVFNLKWEKES